MERMAKKKFKYLVFDNGMLRIKRSIIDKLRVLKEKENEEMLNLIRYLF